MKYLKYLLIAIVVLVALFFGKGLITPSVQYENEITVNKPAKEAWAVMSDESKLSQWLKGLKKMELVSGTAGTVGAVSKIYFDEDGQEMVMEETITNVEQNKLMAMTFTMDFMDMKYEISFDEKGGQTTIQSKSTTIGNGLFAQSMISFMGGAMKSQEDENLNSLKKVIEENTTNYFSKGIIEPEEETEAISEEEKME